MHYSIFCNEMPEVYLRNKELSVATIDKYLSAVKKLRDYLPKEEIGKEMLIMYKMYMLESGLSKSSINISIAAINSFLGFCKMDDMKIKSLRLQRNYFLSGGTELTIEEYIKMVETAQEKGNEKMALLIQTICSTGIRISELPFITVEGIIEGLIEINLKGKIRVIMVADSLADKLMKYCLKNDIKSGSIFVSSSGKPLDRSNVWRSMNRIAKDAGVDSCKVYPHNFRHLFARVYYEKYGDLAHLADILGHSSINTTRIYIRDCGDTEKMQINSLGLVV